MLKSDLEKQNLEQRKEIRQLREDLAGEKSTLSAVRDAADKLRNEYMGVLKTLAAMNFREKITIEQPDGRKEEHINVPQLGEHDQVSHRFR